MLFKGQVVLNVFYFKLSGIYLALKLSAFGRQFGQIYQHLIKIWDQICLEPVHTNSRSIWKDRCLLSCLGIKPGTENILCFEAFLLSWLVYRNILSRHYYTSCFVTMIGSTYCISVSQWWEASQNREGQIPLLWVVHGHNSLDLTINMRPHYISKQLCVFMGDGRMFYIQACQVLTMSSFLLTENCASRSSKAFLNFSNVSCFSARSITYSAETQITESHYEFNYYQQTKNVKNISCIFKHIKLKNILNMYDIQCS